MRSLTRNLLMLLNSTGDPNAAIDASIRSKLTSYWKLDEASGTRADSIGSNNLTANGTGGVGSAAGKLSNAAYFVSANSQYLSIADNASVSIGNNSFEWFGWIYSIDALPSAIALINKEGDYSISANLASVFIITKHGGVAKLAQKNLTVSQNTWYFFSAAFDKDAQQVSIDVNNSGTRVTAATSSSTVDDGSSVLTLGARVASAFWGGYIDEVGYCKGNTLTAAERTRIFNAGACYNGFL